MKKLGEKWKNATAEEKAPYEEESRKDKERYDRECKELGIEIKETKPKKQPKAGNTKKDKKKKPKDDSDEDEKDDESD